MGVRLVEEATRDADDAAGAVILAGFADERFRPFILALQYKGWIDANAIAEAFPDHLTTEDPVEAILRAAPTPEPDWRSAPGTPERSAEEVTRQHTNVYDETPRPSWEPPVVTSLVRWNPARPRPSGAERRAQMREFARWIEGSRDYAPGLAGDIDE